MLKMPLLSLSVLTVAALVVGCGAKADTVAPAEPAPVAKEEAPARPPAKPIPDGFFTLTPQLTVKGVDQAADFYVNALGAQKLMSMPGPDGKAMHAEIRVGDSIIMLDEENLEQGMKSPLGLGGTSATMMVYVDDVDGVFGQLTGAGATTVMPPDDMFWGDRYAEVSDPFGHRWALATHIEELTDEQMMKRAELAMAPPPKAKKGKKAQKVDDKPWRAIAGTPAQARRPAQYHSVTPAFVVADAAATIEFYKSAFGATEIARMPAPDGKLMHAELKFGDSILMLSDENLEMGAKSPATLGGAAVALHMYSEDVDGLFAQATAAKAIPVMPIGDMFWGDRYGAVVDIAGYMWGLATHKEDLSPEEMAERMKAQMAAS